MDTVGVIGPVAVIFTPITSPPEIAKDYLSSKTGKDGTSLETLHASILREQELAGVRLRRSGEEPVGMVVALGAFETPKPIREP